MMDIGPSDIERRARRRREFKDLSDVELCSLVKRVGEELATRGTRRWRATRERYGFDRASAVEDDRG